MEMKLTDELPVAEGMVEKVNVSERQIDIDMGRETKIKKGMKLIVYQAGPRMDDGQLPDQDLKESGRARIEIIGEKKSVAILDKETDEESIKPAPVHISAG